MHSIIAVASSSGVALGIRPFPDVVSAKMGRTSRTQLGQIAGATEPLFAHRIPATKVPCMQAALLVCVHLPPNPPGISRIFAPARSGWSMATGPSINPTFISGLPLVSSINAVSLTKSKGLIKQSFAHLSQAASILTHIQVKQLLEKRSFYQLVARSFCDTADRCTLT
jgi:hypothetical protein